jgi:hypothetical protein
LQEDALQKAGCEKIFRDIASGAVDSRKGLSEAIEYARDGDTLVVWKLDRLGRSLKHLIETVNTLADRQGWFSEPARKHGHDHERREIDLSRVRRFVRIRARTHPRTNPAGLRAARARGRNGGRPMGR